MVVNHGQSCVVPDSLLKYLATKSGLFLATVSGYHGRFLSGVKSNWFRFCAPGSVFLVSLCLIGIRDSWVLCRPSAEDTIILNLIVIALEVYRRDVVHVRIEQVVQSLWLLVIKVGQKQFVTHT